MNGWTGNVLRINLSNSTFRKEPLKMAIAKDYIGGRGLGSKYLLDEVNPKVDPFAAENKLYFATGPVTGTAALGASRYEVITKSPLTGAIASSNSGGYWGPELKFAGFDMIIVEGRAQKPVYVWIEDDKIEIRSAEDLWGYDTIQTQEKIKTTTHKKAKIVCIGPAGEKLVRFACIINDEGRAAGRSGVGAVMGSKNLKAIAVKGSKKVSVADVNKLKNIVKEAWAELPKEQGLIRYGTAYTTAFNNEFGMLPTRNWQTGVFEGVAKIDHDVVNSLLVRRSPCWHCPIGCGRYTKLKGDKYEGEGAGPEYEGVNSLGSNCGIDNIEAIVKAYYICNEQGMDVMSCGHTIACAMEMFEKGFLSEKDVGMKLNWGNDEAMVELVKKTANREGFGDLLAEGSYRFAEKFGHPELSMTIKKQEMPGYDPRGIAGEGLGYVTSNVGADHVRNHLIIVELFSMDKDRNAPGKPKLNSITTQGKAKLLIEVQNESASSDSMGICAFLSAYKIGIQNVLQELETVTGVEYGIDGFMKAGDRIWNIEKLFNLGAGLTAADDTLPKRFLEEPIPEGPFKGNVFKLGEMLPEYYRLRGWDKNGVPTESKLKELGLSEYVSIAKSL